MKMTKNAIIFLNPLSLGNLGSILPPLQAESTIESPDTTGFNPNFTDFALCVIAAKKLDF